MNKTKQNLQAKLTFSLRNNGIGIKFRNRFFSLSYPKKIWKNYPKKEKDFLFDNLAYLLTITFPLVSEFKTVQYNTSSPLFKPYFQQMVIRDIPSSTEDYPVSTAKTVKGFMNLEVNFKNYHIKNPLYQTRPAKNRLIIPLSFGKDSLLTLAVAREIGFEPIAVYINDTVSGLENSWKLDLVKKLSQDFKIETLVITNQIEKLNDFEYWNKNESSLGYAHMIAGFCFLSLPLTYFFKASYIALGNQQDMSFSFWNKEGYRAFPSFDQSLEGTKQLDSIISLATQNKVRLISLIEPLTNLAITKILNQRYPELAKFQISCDALNTLNNRRKWCLNCSKCARLFIFMKAWGINPEKLGFTRELLGKSSEKLYRLFSGKLADNYEKSKEARDEQLLAFYLAYKKGARGYLMDKFKKTFLDEAKRRNKWLRKNFLKLHSMETIPRNLRSKVRKIYYQEIKKNFYLPQ